MTAAPESVQPTDEDYHDETWGYAGIRLSEGKRWTAWVDETGNERLYRLTKPSQFAVGYLYTVKIARIGDRVWMRGAPKFTGDKHDNDQVRIDWAAADRIALTTEAEDRRERKAKTAGNPLDEAIKPLLKAVGGYRNRADQDAIAAWIIGECHRAWATGIRLPALT
jgi:hypothetical protein